MLDAFMLRVKRKDCKMTIFSRPAFRDLIATAAGVLALIAIRRGELNVTKNVARWFRFRQTALVMPAFRTAS
jgi:hypothetical protein